MREPKHLLGLGGWLLPMLMNGQVKVGEVKPSRSLSSVYKDLEGLSNEKEYVQDEELGMAAEDWNAYNKS